MIQSCYNKYFFLNYVSVGGVMAFLTLHEMLPLAFDYAGQKQAVKAVFIGMAFMSAR
jgi:ZIP family zinc transporter